MIINKLVEFYNYQLSKLNITLRAKLLKDALDWNFNIEAVDSVQETNKTKPVEELLWKFDI